MKRRSKNAAIVGGAVALSLMMAAPVYAETEKSEKNTSASVRETREQEDLSVMDTEYWEDKAAANVQTYGVIRTYTSENAQTEGVILPGCEAEVLGSAGKWTRIRSGGITGYIETDSLVFGEEARVHYKNVYGFDGTVTADVLNVRRDASTESSVVAQEAQGEKVRILEEQDGWYLVEQDGQEAYVSADYVELGDLSHSAMTEEEYQQKLAQEEAARQAEEAARQAEEAARQAEAQRQAQAQAASSSSGAVSGSDLDLLAALIQCEAGGESRTGKVAVGAVVLNRVASASFPDSISGVIYQSGQFTPARSGALANVLASGARSDCYEAARAALNGENPVGSCLYFNSGSGQGIQIGNQHFY